MRDMQDEFAQALRDVKVVENDFNQRMGLIEQQNQVSVWSNQIKQSDVLKTLQLKVNKFDEEVTSLYKNINEIKSLQTLGGPNLTSFVKPSGPNDRSREPSNGNLSMPKTVKEVYEFWALTR